MCKNSDNSMLDDIYLKRQDFIEETSTKDREILKEKLHKINLDEVIELINSDTKKEELIEKLNLLTENYNIKIAYYMEKYYKQGFKDGLNLNKECK